MGAPPEFPASTRKASRAERARFTSKRPASSSGSFERSLRESLRRRSAKTLNVEGIRDENSHGNVVAGSHAKAPGVAPATAFSVQRDSPPAQIFQAQAWAATSIIQFHSGRIPDVPIPDPPGRFEEK